MPGMCFVIMGFGKKVDYSDGKKKPRTLDLDATYRSVIKPAVIAAGLECVRADEISNSGLIDTVMYQMLLRADLVIADISTANPNAIYELGVRHALRPRTTIVIKEVDGKFMFDLNHLATLQYKHLGEDIGASEAQLKQTALRKLIEDVLANGTPDSPVYAHLQDLKQPAMPTSEFEKAVAEAKSKSDTVWKEVELARASASENPSNHGGACRHYQNALKLLATSGTESGSDPFLVQQVALHTYKAQQPDKVTALREAWNVLAVLMPETSTDPETLGIGGAIQKRLWEALKNRENLDQAIELYGRGFEIKRDYYNGENYAVCLDLRAANQVDAVESDYDRRTAGKVRSRIFVSLAEAFKDPSTVERIDYKWMLASMANVGYALGKSIEAAEFEAQFRSRALAWELSTFEGGKKYALELAKGVGLPKLS